MTADIDLNADLVWSGRDRQAVDTARILAMDAVEKAGNGHPGTAMSLAPAAYLLFQHIMRHDPSDPQWAGRDRCVLSCGHSSLTLYTQLFLAGYGLSLDDLRSLRQWGSLTPGHPEYGHTPGVETTTGPLGQGLGNAVGMAMASRRERGLFDPDAPPGDSPFDHTIYVLCSDGDIQEGISHEVSSLAGHLELGNLIVIYDDNRISIEDDTSIAMSEDVAARYEAYGWHVQKVTWVTETGYHEDVHALYEAVHKAKTENRKPSIIILRTIIGWPSPHLRNTGKIHGAAIGRDEVSATKNALGFDPTVDFPVSDEVLDHTREAIIRGQKARHSWAISYEAWRAANPTRAALFDRLAQRGLPPEWTDTLPTFAPSHKGLATRAASGKIINAIAEILPELWGGSADLAGSNNTTITGHPSFAPPTRGTKAFPGDWYGRTLHFGIREHGMGAILNGMALHGGTRPYGGTFLVFSDYMRPAVRLAALMKLPIIYVWTHDSIGLGEDGPTHQPVEHLATLRAIPGLDVVRPADANETVWAWRMALEHTDRPTALCLTRQAVPIVDRNIVNDAEGVQRGGYILAEASSDAPKVIIIGTGSEVQICLTARDILEREGISTRVVSMPCQEWFRAQDTAYKNVVLPPEVLARVSVEAGVSMGWHEFVGKQGECVSLDHFGASAPYAVLFDEFGFTADHVVAAAKTSMNRLSDEAIISY